MKQPMKNTLWSILALGFMATAFAASIAQSQTNSELEASLKERSHRLFQYDQNVRRLPSNKLYSLSIAIRFKDYAMAEAMIQNLEKETR